VKDANGLTLREAIKEFLGAYRLDDKLLEKQVIASWGKVMGKMVAKHTVNLSIRKKTLYVKLDNSALSNELLYAREKICLALNREVRADVIKEVVIL